MQKDVINHGMSCIYMITLFHYWEPNLNIQVMNCSRRSIPLIKLFGKAALLILHFEITTQQVFGVCWVKSKGISVH